MTTQELAAAAGEGAPAYSNIRPADYVGPAVCGECHEDNYAAWKQHPHSRMNQPVGQEAVLGDFSGVALDYGGQRAVFGRRGEDFVVEYFAGDERLRAFKITRTVGWRYEQDYVGVQIEGPEPADDPLYSREARLKFSYSLTRRAWLPQSYLEPTEYPGPEYAADGSLRHDPYVPQLQPFNRRCARCHNTYPYDLRFYRIHTPTGMLSGFPPGPPMPAGAVGSLAGQAGDEALLGAETLPFDRLVSVGISCESCHFGGREHAKEEREIRFVPSHPLLGGWPTDPANARDNPAVINAICRQCHHSGASAPDNWPDGAAGVNSMESTEMDRGACRPQIRCTDCHDTHQSGPVAGVADRTVHINACLDCHTRLQEPAAARAHARHAPGEASCLDCHMPRIVQGFETYNRSHRISSPSEPQILGTGMPNACNLCHLDKSLAWTREALASGWGNAPVLPAGLRDYFGKDLERPVGEAWLEHPFPAMRTVAAGAYARSPLGKGALPRLVEGLGEENAYQRMRFLQSVERVLGRRLQPEEYEPTAPPPRRRAQVEALRRALAAQRD